MSVLKPIHAVLFQSLIILSISSTLVLSNTLLCPDIEKHSLLTFKQSLKDPSNRLSSWNGEVDCCEWQGVVCNNSTGHVTELHLGAGIGGRLSGQINPCLLNLKFLTHLDLSLNSFGGKIPQNIGNLSNLHFLNLDSNQMLEADSLEWLWGLSKLEHLNMNYVDLSRATNWAKVINSLPSLLELNFSSCSLDFTSPVNDANLSFSLTFIDLSSNKLRLSLAVPPWVFQLNNLLYLDLSLNSFGGPIPPVINATKLQYFDLSRNSLNSTIPESLYFCKDLEFLSLTFNGFMKGDISSSIGNLTFLKNLDLSHNQFSGKLPREIANLCRMQSLDLSSNQLSGKMQDSFGNMSDCFLRSLEVLRLWQNLLSGHLTEQFGEFRSLRNLGLAFNSLSGAIPVSFGNISSLEELWLQGNIFTGNIPKSFGQLSSLAFSYIDSNKLEGIVTESHFANLSKLVSFVASGNHLTLDVGQNWIPPIQLVDLELGSWSLGKGYGIPSWLQAQRNITVLDISNAGISGRIPHWFLNILYLNVSLNNLQGNLPDMIGCTECYIPSQFLFMSCNNFSGSLPRIGEYINVLDLSHNSLSEGISHLLCDTTHETYLLQALVLEGNRLSGELPDCWKKWPALQILKLGNNTMSGSIPKSVWFWKNLVSLSFYHNNFSGPIPPLANFSSTSLLKIDLSYNNLGGKIPAWMFASLVNLKILILRSNKLSGEISPRCNLQSLQILDLSNNHFFGVIPRCVSNFSAMATKRVLNPEILDHGFWYVGDFSRESASIVTKGVELEYGTTLSLVTIIDLSRNNFSGGIPNELTSLVELRSLNLSENNFTGLIPKNIGAMKQLESLDFSKNSLLGQIPSSLRLLSYLSHLNLSFNKLTGRIPESTQIQSLDASSFIGNYLCGPPLNNCSSGGDRHEKKEKEGDDKSKIEWLYVLLSLGYAMGFSAVCTTLVLKKSWRDAYFGMLECMWDKIYVYLYVKWRRLTKPAASISPS